MSKPFKFKQFTVEQDRCAMKIGTDGVLLAAWTTLDNNPASILDIGSGTGLIALILAQRSKAGTIDAIEIDESAYEQCVENFEASPWGDRLFCYHADLEEFTDEMDEKYDLIVSNPPFYKEDVPCGNKARDMARQNQSLPFDELLESASHLLSPKGVLSVIIPYTEEEALLKLASKNRLLPKRITRVKGNPKSELKRTMLELSFNKNDVALDELTIEISRHEYSEKYRELTKDFYLKM